MTTTLEGWTEQPAAAPRGGILFRRGQGGRGSQRPSAREEAREQEDRLDEQPLCCRACGQPITEEAAALYVHGKHEYHFFNPAGILFHIGCYSLAPGCRVLGLPTDEFTWFSGYAWQLAACGRCNAHLGWRFTGNGPPFFALILPRISRMPQAGQRG